MTGRDLLGFAYELRSADLSGTAVDAVRRRDDPESLGRGVHQGSSTFGPVTGWTVGLTPEEIVEALLQTAPVGGITRAQNATMAAGRVFERRGVDARPTA